MKPAPPAVKDPAALELDKSVPDKSNETPANVAPELAHFSGIVPCGIRDDGVTSLAERGSGAGLEELDLALRRAFEQRIGPTCEAAAGTLAAADGTSLAPA